MAIVAILDFQSQQFSYIFIYKSPCCFLATFESIILSVQEKKRKKYFHVAAILDFRAEKIKLHLIYKSPDASYQVSSQLVLQIEERKWKIYFQDCSHGRNLEFPIGTTSYFRSTNHPDAP